MDKECAVAILFDANEEEKKKDKESEKKFGEKDLFLNQSTLTGNFFLQNQESENTEYLLPHSDFKAEILLPPPEKLI